MEISDSQKVMVLLLGDTIGESVMPTKMVCLDNQLHYGLDIDFLSLCDSQSLFADTMEKYEKCHKLNPTSENCVTPLIKQHFVQCELKMDMTVQWQTC